jgi:hypothetical protein
LGKKQSGNIRFTVGQYWLIIKINGTNSVNFVGNSVNFVVNFVMLGNLFDVPKIVPLQWYTDRNFFGDGGGGAPKLICFGKKIFGTGRAQSEKSGKFLSGQIFFK